MLIRESIECLTPNGVEGAGLRRGSDLPYELQRGVNRNKKVIADCLLSSVCGNTNYAALRVERWPATIPMIDGRLGLQDGRTSIIHFQRGYLAVRDGWHKKGHFANIC